MTEYEIKRLCETIKTLIQENTNLEKENRLLGERCNQLLKDKGDLTDQIADIKANCDLAIEGRDVKIKELEQELTVQKDLLQEETNLHLHAEDYIKSLEQQIVKLKADIEQAIEDANRWKETETFSVLNRIYYDNFEITKEIEK